MPHLHKKIINGKPYYYVRETARINGKSKVINQVYVGTAQRILELTTSPAQVKKLQVREFGSLWLAHQIENEIDIVSIIDTIIKKGKRDKGPSVGEYFLYAVFNRMVDSRSKRGLLEWYKATAIQQIRPVNVSCLTSEQYWKKWDKVSAEEIKKIAAQLFKKLQEVEPSDSNCLLFDTTNYYTFMASTTESQLAKRGKNKEGRHNLRQIGMALLVSRDKKLPIFYEEYEGNQHDSKLFLKIMKKIFKAIESKGSTKDITIIFDKGMNSDENIAAIDMNKKLHFITSYSTSNAKELVKIDLSEFNVLKGFEDVDARNQKKVWRTSGVYWGKRRTVVVTYNPITARKQIFMFEEKIQKLEAELENMRTKISAEEKHWRNETTIKKRYKNICRKLHIPHKIYILAFSNNEGKLKMVFHKNNAEINSKKDHFGKNIIITDNEDWTTEEIISANDDRYIVEHALRQTKDDDLVSVYPIRHWTDSKIKCHFLTCIITLTFLRLIEIRLHRAGINITSATAMDHMQRLHSCLVWVGKSIARTLEEPSEIQEAILNAFHYTREVVQVSTN